MTTLRSRLAAGAVAAALLAGAPAAMAWGQTSTTTRSSETIDQVKTRAHDAIQRRETALDGVITRLGQAPHLSADHKSRLTSDLAAQKTSLSQLDAQIQAATTAAQLRSLVPQIVTGHYVFAFQIPRARLVVAADTVGFVAGRLDTIHDKLQTKVEAAKAKYGEDKVKGAEAALKDMAQQTTTASNGAKADADKVMALNVDGYPGNRQVLVDARQDLGQDRHDLGVARHDAAQVIADLKALSSTP